MLSGLRQVAGLALRHLMLPRRSFYTTSLNSAQLTILALFPSKKHAAICSLAEQTGRSVSIAHFLSLHTTSKAREHSELSILMLNEVRW
jgi:hypothetical protein